MPAVAAVAVAALGSRSAWATFQYWDTNGASSGTGGSGTWNASSASPFPLWNGLAAGTGTPQAWANTSSSDAFFNGTTGTVSIASDGVTAHNVVFAVAGYALGGPGTLTLAGSAPTFTLNTSPGTTSISAVLAGSSGLTFNGASSTYIYAISGLNTYSGTTIIQACTFNFNNLANDNVASSVGMTGNVLIGNSSATFVNYVGAGAAATDRTWTFNGSSGSTSINNNSDNTNGGAISFNSSGSAVGGTDVARTVNLGGTFTTSANRFNEMVADTGTGANITSVNIKAGKWDLTGANTYTGPTTISSSTTVGGIGAHAFGSTSSIIIPATGILDLKGDVSTTFTKAGGDGTTLYSVTTTGSGATIFVDNANSAVTSPRTMAIGAINTSSAAVSGVTFAFNGSNNTSLVTGTITGPLTTAATPVALSNRMPVTSSGTVTIASYTSATTAGSEVLSIGGVGNTVVTGAITPSAGNTLSLVKSGTGSLTLLGASPYTGGTNIAGGKLVVGPSGTLGSGTTVINTTGILAGNGSVGDVVVNNGGEITAGGGPLTTDSIDTLNTGGQTWTSGGLYVAKVSDGAGTSNDTLVMSSLSVNASSSAPFNISLQSVGSTTLGDHQQLVLAFIKGAAQGSFNTSALSLATTNVTGSYAIALQDTAGTYNGVSGDELLAVVSAAPEPTSLLLAGLAAAPLALGRRRRGR